MSEYPHRTQPGHEHDWNEPPWAVYCTDPYCDLEMTVYLAAKDARIAALEALVRDVAADHAALMAGEAGECPFCHTDYRSEHDADCPVTRARALLANGQANGAAEKE